MQVRVGAEDLDGVLVRPDGAVRADAEEDGAQGLVVLDVEVLVVGQARPGHVVVDADREPGRGMAVASSLKMPATMPG